MRNKHIIIGYCVTGFACFALGFFAKDIANGVSQWNLSSLFIRDNDDWQIVQVTDYEMENGYIYTGDLRNGFRYGYGRMITLKGTVYEGEWVKNYMVEGTMITEKSEYTGKFGKLSPNGYGLMRYRNGSYYRGNWEDGVKSGIGMYVDSIGNKSFGFWKRGIVDEDTRSQRIEHAIYGIDLSHHNNLSNWGQLAIYTNRKGAVLNNVPEKDFEYQPIQFVYMKATEGATHRDRNYLENMMNAKKHHKARGSYHFMHLTSSTVEEQVENFLDYLIYEKGDLPPALDIEVRNQAYVIGKVETQKRVLQWLSMVEEKLGVRPIIYTSVNMRKDFFTTKDFDRYQFWVAQYDCASPETPDYSFWQCTDKGELYGNHITPIDVNVFNGNISQFKKLIK